MTRRKSPWQILGIKRTATEREIKSAYARKLKVTRPEDDAEAFQRLVEARDTALFHTRNRAEEALPEAAPILEETPSDVISEPPRLVEEEEASAHSPIVFHDNPEAETETPLLDSGFEAADSAQQDIEAVKSNDEPDPAIDTIIHWLSGEAAIESFAEVDRQVRLVSEMSLMERGSAELDFLFALSNRLMADEAAPFDSATNHLVESLDQEFGWTKSDRHIVDTLGFGAHAVIDRLHYLHNPSAAPSQQKNKPNHWGWIWIAVILIWALLRFASGR